MNIRTPDLPWPGGHTADDRLFGAPPPAIGQPLIAWSDIDSAGKLRRRSSQGAAKLQLLALVSLLSFVFCGCPTFIVADRFAKASGPYSIPIALGVVVLVTVLIQALVSGANSPRCVYVGREGIADLAPNESKSSTVRFEDVAYVLESHVTVVSTAVGMTLSESTAHIDFMSGDDRCLLRLLEGNFGAPGKMAEGIVAAGRAWTDYRLQTWRQMIEGGRELEHAIVRNGKREGALVLAPGKLVANEMNGFSKTLLPSNVSIRVSGGILRLLSPLLVGGSREYALGNIGNASGLLALLPTQGFEIAR